MKSVVMIAYAFPPEGNAGAYRPLRFARHLPALGWRPTVISVATNVYERYDPELLNSLPTGTEVIRIRNPDPWNALQEWRDSHSQKNLSARPVEKVGKICKAHQAPLRYLIRQTTKTIEGCCYHPDKAMGWIRPAV